MLNGLSQGASDPLRAVIKIDLSAADVLWTRALVEKARRNLTLPVWTKVPYAVTTASKKSCEVIKDSEAPRFAPRSVIQFDPCDDGASHILAPMLQG